MRRQVVGRAHQNYKSKALQAGLLNPAHARYVPQRGNVKHASTRCKKIQVNRKRRQGTFRKVWCSPEANGNTPFVDTKCTGFTRVPKALVTARRSTSCSPNTRKKESWILCLKSTWRIFSISRATRLLYREAANLFGQRQLQAILESAMCSYETARRCMNATATITSDTTREFTRPRRIITWTISRPLNVFGP